MEKFCVTLPSLDTSQIKSTFKILRTKNNNQSLAQERIVNLIILGKKKSRMNGKKQEILDLFYALLDIFGVGYNT